MSDIVSLTDVSVTIGKTSILKNLSLRFPSGSVVGLLGPSGAGKTTLMRTIVGLQHSTTGTVVVMGQRAGSRELRSNIGYMTQNLSIYPDLTVLENLRYFASICGANKEQIVKIIKRLRLDGLENHLISAVSGGQKTRVSLGAALLGEPPLLVLDEPTVGIDPLIRSEIWDFLNEIAASGTTLIISSHVMDEAIHCSHLVLLRDGMLLANDTPEALMNRTHQKTMEATFLELVRSSS